jgi:hypothetical protein
LPAPRSSLFQICDKNFHFALPVDAVVQPLESSALGQLLSETAANVKPERSLQETAATQPAQPPDPQEKPVQPSKPKEKKAKKEKEKKV